MRLRAIAASVILPGSGCARNESARPPAPAPAPANAVLAHLGALEPGKSVLVCPWPDAPLP